MKVLNVVDTLGVGGTELGLAKVVERTQGRVAHSVCCVRDGGATADRLQSLGVPVSVLHKPPGNDWSVPFRIARLCREIRPDVVHTRNWGSIDGIIAGRLARVPVVIHGEHGREASDVDGSNRRRNRARRILSLFVDRMVAVSEHLFRWLVDDVGVRRDKVALLRNGVDLTRFRRAEDRDRLRRRHGYSPSDFIVGTVGRLDPVKNQVALLELQRALSASHPNMRVIVVGDGPERETLQREASRRGLDGTVRVLGQRDDVPELLSLFDVFVLPSLAEGMCNTVLEAMATGLPVVATRVGGNPELVVDGTTGRLVPSGDLDALAQAIRFYAADEHSRRTHGDAGSERVLQHFSIEGMVDGYVSLYQSELARRSRSHARGAIELSAHNRS